MNLKLKKALQSLKNRFKRDNKDSGEYIHPLRDWAVGLLSAVVVFLMGVLFIGYDFYLQFSSPQTDVVPEEKIVKYPDKEVQFYVDKYKKRDESFTKMRSEWKMVIQEEKTEVVPEATATTATTATTT